MSKSIVMFSAVDEDQETAANKALAQLIQHYKEERQSVVKQGNVTEQYNHTGWDEQRQVFYYQITLTYE